MIVPVNSEPSFQMTEGQVSIWDTPSQPNNTKIDTWRLSRPNSHQCLRISTENVSANHVDYTERKKTRNDHRYCPWSDSCSCCVQGFILGCLLAGLALAIIIAFWLTSSKTTTTFTIETISLSGASSSTVTTTTTSTTTSTATPTCASWLWNTTGETVAGVTNTPDSTPDKLNEPWNIYVDPTNNILYIADSKNHRIQRWLPGAVTGTTVAGTTGSPGSSATLLDTPRDVFVDSSQNIYVADSKNKRIQFFPNGSTMGVTLSSGWPTTGELWGVQVVTGSIYACDNNKGTVWKNGTVVVGNQANGPGANQLNQPQGFAVDASVAIGTIYATNTQQHTIVQWSVNASTGSVVAGSNGSPGNAPTLLQIPLAIKLDSYTNMFVVDNNNHRIQLFCRYPTINTTGRTIAGTSTSGFTPQALDFPAGIALDASLNLYVSDTSNHRIQRFRRIL